MKLITLLENTACAPEFFCEHGLSLYLETGDRKVLFDAGQTGAFADNAARLGVDLAGVDTCVLSHGHYDHGGGLGRFLACNERATVYVNQYAFEPHYNAAGKYIGLDPALEASPRLRQVGERLDLGGGLTLLTLPLPPADSAGMTAGALRGPEDFRHEQYLLVEEHGRRILLSGCSHKGILQIMDHFRPDILIGGFHFMKVEDEAFLRQAAEALLRYPTTYYTGHCTGQAQFAVMKTVMGDRLRSLSVGSTWII